MVPLRLLGCSHEFCRGVSVKIPIGFPRKAIKIKNFTVATSFCGYVALWLCLAIKSANEPHSTTKGIGAKAKNSGFSGVLTPYYT